MVDVALRLSVHVSVYKRQRIIIGCYLPAAAAAAAAAAADAVTADAVTAATSSTTCSPTSVNCYFYLRSPHTRTVYTSGCISELCLYERRNM